MRYRVFIIFLAIIGLVIGITGGLQRLGWVLPFNTGNAVVFHGPLMICVFLGTVISLERAVAIGKTWPYLAPLTAGLSGLMLFSGMPSYFAIWMLIIASVMYAIAMIHLFLRQRASHVIVLLLGALSWLIGNITWLLDFPIHVAVLWWMNFLLLTIAGERLELTRFLPSSRLSKVLFFWITFLLFISACIPILTTNGLNFAFFSFALAALAIWLLWYDIARKTVKQQGVTRYIAVCLLSGYCWLLIAALVGLSTNLLISGGGYDAFLHAVFIGFVFSMIFGHAVIIFPAILKIKMRYNKILYLALFVLHGSLLIRVAGDLLQITAYKKIGGMLTVFALIIFFITNVSATLRRNANSHP